MTLVTANVQTVIGDSDNSAWTFFSTLREAADGSIVTGAQEVLTPSDGELEVSLEPGSVGVLFAGITYWITVPEDGPADLWDLLEVAVAIPPDTSAEILAAAIEAYLDENPPSGGGGASDWGDIGGTLSAQSDLQAALNLKAPLASPTFTGTVGGVTKSHVGLGNVDNTADTAKPVSTATQTALDGKVDENSAITGATKTKVTYDAKGLVTGGADATTADIADSSNKRYVTDAQLTVIGNTSGTNTGDQNLSSYATTAAVAAGYQPLDSDLTTWAGKTTPGGVVVGTTDTQTLTGKTVDLTSNTLVGSVSEFNAALESADFYTTGGTNVSLADGGTGADLSDPGADRLWFWDESANSIAWLTLGTNLSITGTTIDAAGGGGGTDVSPPFLLVAASTATTEQKALADYVCDGTADDVQINAAIAALPGGKGKVLLTSGDFNTDASINLGVSQWLDGMGEDSTRIMGQDDDFHVIHMGNRTGGVSNPMTNFVKLSNMSVSALGGANDYDAVWADGLGIGSRIENVKASEGKYNFRITDADQCAFYNIKAYNPRVAGIYCEIGYENTWGNVAFYSPSAALSDNNSTCFLIGANAVQGTPNRMDRLSIYGALFYTSIGLTGTASIKCDVGASAFTVIGSLSENPVDHVVLNDQTQITWQGSTMMHNSPPSVNGFKCSNDTHSITVISSRFQQVTNLFNGVSGTSHICMLGRSENQGNITNILTGSWGSKQGTDTVFLGNGIMALGLNNDRYDWTFTNNLVVNGNSPASGKFLKAQNSDGETTWANLAAADISDLDDAIADAVAAALADVPRMLIWDGDSWPDLVDDARPAIFSGGSAATDEPDDADIDAGDLWFPEEA